MRGTFFAIPLAASLLSTVATAQPFASERDPEPDAAPSAPAAPGNTFSVADDGDLTTGNIIDLVGSTTSWRLQNGGFYLDFRHDNGFLATLDGNGRLGVGVFIPQEALDVDGTIRSRDLAGLGTRSVMADENGNLVAGEAIGIVSIGPAAFQSAFPFFDKDYTVTETQAFGHPQEPVPLIADVQLPHGAEVIGVVFNYRDASAEDRLDLSLRRSQNVSAALDILATFETSGAESQMRQEVVPIDPPAPVDNLFYYYYLRLVSEVDDGTVHQAGWDDMFVRSVQIYYIRP